MDNHFPTQAKPSKHDGKQEQFSSGLSSRDYGFLSLISSRSLDKDSTVRGLSERPSQGTPGGECPIRSTVTVGD